MSDVQADTRHREIIFHDDDETPLQFVLELLHSVFKKQLADSFRFTDAVQQEGQASCGSYPREIAGKLLEEARQRIDASGHPLRITSRITSADDKLFNAPCKLCGDLFGYNKLTLKGTVTLVCDECVNGISSQLSQVVRKKQFGYAYQALASHFAGIPLDQLAATSRQFPGHMRADVQAGVDKLFSVSPLRFFGIHEEHRYETLSLAALSRDGRNAPTITPAQYHDVDVGEGAPMKCLNNGLWLCQAETCATPSCSLRIESTAVSQEPGSRSPCPLALRARSSCNDASPNWSARSMKRVVIAARSSRSMPTGTIADAQEASWSTNCRRFNATTSSCPRPL